VNNPFKGQEDLQLQSRSQKNRKISSRGLKALWFIIITRNV